VPQASATYPGQNGLIAFSALADDQYQIYTVRPNGHHLRQVTHVDGGAVFPDWSPDGRRIVFERDHPDGPPFCSISIMNGNGSGVRQLMPPSSDIAVKQDWAPSGARIVFTTNADVLDKPANIATIRPDGSGLRYLTDFGSPDLRAYVGGYSPDGHWIVFRLEDHGSYGLYRMHPDGGAMHPILRLSSFKPRYIDWGPRARSDSGRDE